MTKIHKKIVCLTKIFTVTFRFSPPTVGNAHARVIMALCVGTHRMRPHQHQGLIFFFSFATSSFNF